MNFIICIFLFLSLSFWQVKLLFDDYGIIPSPYGDNTLMKCTGLEMLLLVIFSTGYIGLAPVLALRLGFLELIILIGLFKSSNKSLFSFPLALFLVFLLWTLWGLAYTPNKAFGVRMILKYIYPFLVALFAAKVVRDKEIFLKAGLLARLIGTIGIVFLTIPILFSLFHSIFWYRAALITGLIPAIVFSFALADFSNERKKNLIWGCLLCLPCIYVVLRTDIFGTAVAMSVFFLIKYRVKALPMIGAMGVLGLCVMFYVPAVKNKMFIDPDKVTMMDYLTFNIDEENVQTNMRKFMWEDATKRFYEGHEMMGSGTGRVQTFFYNEATDARRGGQLHNDFLVLQCDNGLIGLGLFLLSYVAIMIHCMMIYHSSRDNVVRMAALVAGSSLMGVGVTMFSDNTLSYSMVTLSFPWGFYGMTLGLKEKFN